MTISQRCSSTIGVIRKHIHVIFLNYGQWYIVYVHCISSLKLTLHRQCCWSDLTSLTQECLFPDQKAVRFTFRYQVAFSQGRRKKNLLLKTGFVQIMSIKRTLNNFYFFYWLYDDIFRVATLKYNRFLLWVAYSRNKYFSLQSQ